MRILKKSHYAPKQRLQDKETTMSQLATRATSIIRRDHG